MVDHRGVGVVLDGREVVAGVIGGQGHDRTTVEGEVEP